MDVFHRNTATDGHEPLTDAGCTALEGGRSAAGAGETVSLTKRRAQFEARCCRCPYFPTRRPSASRARYWTRGGWTETTDSGNPCFLPLGQRPRCRGLGHSMPRCTRALDHLLVTGIDPASEFLDHLLAHH